MTTKKVVTTAKATKAVSPAKTVSKAPVPTRSTGGPTKSSRSSKTRPPGKKTAAAGQVASPAVPVPASASVASKQAQLIAMLRSAEGATVAQMMARTGWQAHTVRGTISGVLRKRLGLVVASVAPIGGSPRVYRLIEAVAA